MHHGKFNVRVFFGGGFVLPSNILSRFTIVRVESDAEALFVRSDEIASAKYVNAPNVESKESRLTR